MKLRLGFALASALIVFGLASTTKAQDPAARYEKVRKIAIGGEGGWDFLEVDSANRKLYVARGNRVIVVDLDTEKVVGEIAGTPGVHGIAFVPGLNRGFTSNGGNSTVTAFDLKTLKTLGTVKANGRPDIIIYEPVSRRVLSFNHATNDITAIDPAAMKVVGTLAAGGVPELACADEKGHVFCNLEDKSEVLEFDAKTMKMIKTYSLAPGEEPTGLAFDAKQRKLFSTCANRKLIVSDADSGKVVQALEIGTGPDGCVFDADRKLIFSSNGGDGTLTIIRETSPGKYEVAGNIKTQVSAKTIALDPKTHRLYLSAATRAATPAAAKKGGRPGYEPGSFVVLVVGE
ncbi:MAG TPA: YncE family protein [Isosphaeraceae bacterium]|nr:YncE family protein [Isosphaeraceae bacterium]